MSSSSQDSEMKLDQQQQVSSHEEAEHSEEISGHLKKTRFQPSFEETKHACYKIFHCKNIKYDVRSFSILDKLNKNKGVFGFICKRDGPLGGSLYVVNVGGKSLYDENSANAQDMRELIFCTPKLRYAYNKDFTDFVDTFEHEERISSYYLSEKWNGTNILLFKYHDAEGNEFISGKTKGMPTLTDSNFGNFLTCTLNALHLQDFIGKYEDLCLRDELIKMHSDPKNPNYMPHMDEFLNNKDIQAMSLEICGNTLPHLVKYDFALDLKPLFFVHKSGKIRPCLKVRGMEEFGPMPYTPFESHKSCIRLCRMLQKDSLERNENYRKKHNLKHKYEYEHFEVEGHVLYLLDDHGFVVSRNSIYKVKPRDVEEVHWEQFDEMKKGQVRDAVLKMKQRGLSLSNEEALRKELDCGDKEWSKFSREILAFIQKEFGNESTEDHNAKKTTRSKKSRDKKQAVILEQEAPVTAASKEVVIDVATEVIASSTNVNSPTTNEKQKRNHQSRNKNKVLYVKKE
ncbi:hypothetical protein C9374_000815 [Naegleria lovaniensis]|uniref:Uncharacterized protein n=1 Tax=Naegleria lovaniensis TaxID=51637 RepID=A0AA88GSA8_NAELO|nr:uncharacterized protein C9374_000815 [Naegleria lovaniensis]KAG2387965.1 hypothetical protein C9374_000815 [Naegleria lovaniensis]